LFINIYVHLWNILLRIIHYIKKNPPRGFIKKYIYIYYINYEFVLLTTTSSLDSATIKRYMVNSLPIYWDWPMNAHNVYGNHWKTSKIKIMAAFFYDGRRWWREALQKPQPSGIGYKPWHLWWLQKSACRTLCYSYYYVFWYGFSAWTIKRARRIYRPFPSVG
jgi:hypothetical protein